MPLELNYENKILNKIDFFRNCFKKLSVNISLGK